MEAPFVRYGLDEIMNALPKYFIASNNDVKVFTNSYGGGFIKMSRKYVSSVREKRDGLYFYIKDRSSKHYWSSTMWPTTEKPDSYFCEVYSNSIRFVRMDGTIESITDCTVSPNDNVEIRRLIIKNTGPDMRFLEVTSYMDITLLDDPVKDIDHPAFHNLFVQSHFDSSLEGLFFSRRTFDADKHLPVLFYRTVTEEGYEFPYETSRSDFIGRLRTVENPVAMEQDLHNSSGDILDPIGSYRHIFDLKPGKEHCMYFVTIHGRNYDEVFNLARKYKAFSRIQAEFNFAVSQKNQTALESHIDGKDLGLCTGILSKMIYGDVYSDSLKKDLPVNTLQPDTLWKHKISGDYPVLLFQLKEETMSAVEQMLKIFMYLRKNRYKFDLVFFNQMSGEEFKKNVTNLIFQYGLENKINDKGGIFILDCGEANRETGGISIEDEQFIIRFARLIITPENVKELCFNH